MRRERETEETTERLTMFMEIERRKKRTKSEKGHQTLFLHPIVRRFYLFFRLSLRVS
jgi:hypothetical protein